MDQAPVVSAVVERPTAELWCEAGQHKWNRPSQRGRKPLSCPDHIAPRESPSEDGAKAQNAPTALTKLCERASERRNELTDPEAQKTVDYIIRRLTGINAATPKDDEQRKNLNADADLLSKRLEDLIRPRR